MSVVRESTAWTRPGTDASIEMIMAALRRLPSVYFADVIQFIEFLDYKATVMPDDSSEDEILWAAVETNRAYKSHHLGEEIERYETGDAFLEAMADL